MQLSEATLEGLRITGKLSCIYIPYILTQFTCLPDAVHSFVEMTQYLLAVPGVQYVLPEKLCQDPIEAFFGKQHAAGGRSDNPTVQQFCENIVSLRVQGSAALEPV